MMRIHSPVVPSIVVACAIALVAPAIAQPPAHAPAHGFRAKQRGQLHFVGQAGVVWERDFGIRSGSCDHRGIATALGGIAGAAIANRVADDDNRVVATLIGAAAGAFIGNRIGRSIDKADEACVGHSLELGVSGQPVGWTNAATGIAYQVVPESAFERSGSTCREFTLTAVSAADRSSRRGLGCESQPGMWQIVR